MYKNNDDYVFHFRELFDKAVESRLRSIGSVAVMMSGGLDSTSIYCNSKKKLS
ncbi:asparagine synthase-related protein [Caldalkalibacillus mannanilyticus]|uniref:asparagine synthase-related protein n=1 Tax=Caldalkalibacillus mannanilyticus TaxID=1418 RepID=UPI000A985770